MEYVNPPCNLLSEHFRSLHLAAPLATVTSISWLHPTITIRRRMHLFGVSRLRPRRECDCVPGEWMREGGVLPRIHFSDEFPPSTAPV